MTDGEYSLLMLVALLALASVYLLAVVRNQRKRIAELSQAGAAVPVERDEEVKRLRARVQVLERIATDGKPSLEMELDELRDR
jgi:hypothetical protein